MKILIDINHPAHVHFFKNVYWELSKDGHELLVTVTKKDIASLLLEKYCIPYIDMGSYGSSMFSKLINLPLKSLKLAFIAKKNKADILLGVSFRVSHAGWLIGKTSFVFDDTEHATNEIRLFKPFATKIFTPECYTKDLGKKQVRYPGYHELAYLHPERFKPNAEVLSEMGLTENEKFFVLRFVAWDASHDIGHKGINLNNKRKLIEILKPHGKIIITSEKPLPYEFEPFRMSICPTKIHSLLYFAALYIGESPTMSTESALLGTPAVLINDWAINAGNMLELMNIYKTMFCYTNYPEAESCIINLILNKSLKDDWRLKSSQIISNKIDVTEFIIDSVFKQYSSIRNKNQ